MEEIFVVTAPGIKPFVIQELCTLGLLNQNPPDRIAQTVAMRAKREEPGGVMFFGDLQGVYRANLHLRTASRILIRVGEFWANTFWELHKKAGRLAWERYLLPGRPVALRVSCHKSRLYHSDAVAKEVAAAIVDRLGWPVEIKKFREENDPAAPQMVMVRLVDDYCTVSIDSSGENLHRRGYRLATAKAPLRETLAAAMLLASGWDARSPLIDPFCGSGTIAIEAALLARRIPPGWNRCFSFFNWPEFDKLTWDTILAEADEAAASGVNPLPYILASDRDAGAVQVARENAARAGVLAGIHFSCRAVSAIEPPTEKGWVVTNPPYGVRVSADKDLRNLYAQIGNVMRAKCPGWQIAMLSSDWQLIHQVGLEFDHGVSLVNGGVRVILAQATISSKK